MRITCPSCKAAYEAPDAEIGVGRSVECSACGARWYQPGATGEAGESRVPGLAQAAEELRALRDQQPEARPPEGAAATAVGDAPEPEPAPAPDAAARQAPEPTLSSAGPEATSGSLQDRAREGGPTAPQTPRAGRSAVDEIPIPPPPPSGEEASRHRRPASVDAQRLTAELRAAEDVQEERSRSPGFALGFVLAVLISAALAGAYLERDRLTVIMPQAGPALEAYGENVDRARGAVERAGEQIRERARPLIDRVRGAAQGG